MKSRYARACAGLLKAWCDRPIAGAKLPLIRLATSADDPSIRLHARENQGYRRLGGAR